MNNFIKALYTKYIGLSSKEITLLIIGPPSCGKTALIYFLYRFAVNHLLGVNPNKKKKVNSPRKKAADNDIKEIELTAFVNEMKKQLEASKDFMGTEPGSIDYINYDTGMLNLKIFNISGEIFADTAANGPVLKKLAEHLDLAEVDHVYCLLADEVKVGIPVNYNVDMFAVNSFFTGQGLKKAGKIFYNINHGINTLRVVTKFDRAYVPACPPEEIEKDNDREFIIYNHALHALNANGYYDNHRVSYKSPDKQSFPSSSDMPLLSGFVCTGLYDWVDFSGDLYEEVEGKMLLKKRYWERNGLNKLEMYGIVAIFYYILKNYAILRKIKVIELPVVGRDNNNKITVADYKSVLKSR